MEDDNCKFEASHFDTGNRAQKGTGVGSIILSRANIEVGTWEVNIFAV